MSEDESIRTAAEAFKAVGHEVRVGVLYELAQRGEPLAFSALMEALELEDSGRLNYHLGKLVGRFVSSTEEGYRLTIHGEKLISSILGGRYLEEAADYSVRVDGTCYRCEAADLMLEQRGEQAIVYCRECDTKQFRKAVSPELWKAREPSTVPAALDRIVWADIEFAVHGLCGYCQSTMTPRVAENRWERDGDLYGFYDFDVVAVHECDQCTNWKYTPYGLLAWRHPDVRHFHRALGVEPTDVKCWQIAQAKDARYTSVEATDPYAVMVRFPRDGAECRVHFDDTNEVARVVQEWPP